jgi:hypothetical protein
MDSKEYAIFRQGGILYRVPKHSAETHEDAFQKAVLLSKLNTSHSSQVKWSIVSAQHLKKQYGLEYTTDLEAYLTNKDLST